MPLKKSVLQKNDLLFGSNSKDIEITTLLLTQNFSIYDAYLPKIETFFKKEKSTLLGLPFLDLIIEQKMDAQALLNAFEMSRKSTFQLIELDNRILKKCCSLIISYLNGAAPFCYVVTLIIPENSYRALRSYINSIIDNLPGAVYWKDLEGHYMGCNKFVAQMAGYENPEDMLGKTDYDFCWNEFADDWRLLDSKVVKENATIQREEMVRLANDEVRTELTFKSPLTNEYNEIVGVIGTSLDITERKNMEEDLKIAKESAESALRAMKQAQIKERKQRKILERLEIENATHKAQLNTQAEFSKTVAQVAHDINTPLTSLRTIAAHCDALPEEERVTLRNATGRLMDITHYLLNLYRPQGDINVDEEKTPIFLSALLRDLMSERSYQYHDSSIQFLTEFSQTGEFAFINAQLSSLARAISNLFNNATHAVEGKKEGVITLKLDANNEWVNITIQDNGKGMNPETLEKIKRNIAFTEGKKDGHGLGLSQVHDMLVRNYGEMDVQSTQGKGTQFTLKFSKYPSPIWYAEKIDITPQDTIVVLDDDPSIHGAWNMRFEPILKQLPNLQLHHFEIGEEALRFINTLNETQRANLVLLTDYELLRQNLTGCDIIANSKPRQAILVTSHYTESEVRDKIVHLNAKMLPKQLAVVIPINLIAPQPESEPEGLRQVDAVWLEDDQTMARTLKFLLVEEKIDFYLTPDELKKHIHLYPKTTRILLDNNFEGPFLNTKGIDIAEELHQQGFTRLFLISGEEFSENEIPDYIKVIPKLEAFNIKSYW